MNLGLIEYGKSIAIGGVSYKAASWGRDSMIVFTPMHREPVFGLIPMPLIWNFIAVLIIALIFWWLIRSSSKNGETPLDLLKKRYASGEIDRETYLKMKEDIRD